MSWISDVLKIISATEVHVVQQGPQTRLEEIKTAHFVGPVIDTQAFFKRSQQIAQIRENSKGMSDEDVLNKIKQLFIAEP